MFPASGCFALVIGISCMARGIEVSSASAGWELRPSLGADLDAWPFGYGATGGLWLTNGHFLAAVHVRGGVLAKHYDASRGGDVGALTAGFGARVGMLSADARYAPYALVGYERAGSISWDAEAGTGGGRNHQELNGELGLKLSATEGIRGVLLGFRGMWEISSSSSAPPGPPFPKVALHLTYVF